MKKQYRIGERVFAEYLSEQEIRAQVERIGAEISRDYEGKHPLMLVILNGAAIFASDLVRQVGIPLEMQFIKVSSYEGMESSGKVNLEFGRLEKARGRHVILVEDILDTGNTLSFLQERLKEHDAASVAICTLLRKPEKLKKDIPVRYLGFDIPDAFVIGYGLDLDGAARHLPAVYALEEGSGE